MTESPVALITGASRSIGLAIATSLAATGARLTLTARNPDVLGEAAENLAAAGTEVLAIAGDVADPGHAPDVVTRTLGRFGQLDTLVNNAGGEGEYRTPVQSTNPGLWWNTLAVNTYGPYLFARAALPGMLERGSGRIITVASRAGIIPQALASAYCVAKTAVIRLTEVLATETAGTGVSVFCLHPGGVVNDRLAELMERGLLSEFRMTDSAQAAGEFVAALASGHYDALSGEYLDVHDDLDDLLAACANDPGPQRVLRVTGLAGLTR